MLNTISNFRYAAASNGAEYLSHAVDLIEQAYPQASPGEKAIAAATLAQTMALDALATAVAGQAEGTPLCAALARYLGESV